MKSLQLLIIVMITLFLASCSSTVKFPVSNVVPAAEISASKTEDKNGNMKISLKAEYLASPERLTPARKTYVVWIYAPHVGIINLGHLSVKNGKSTSFETIIPYKVSEIIITAEDEGNVTYPTGTEISRATFR